MREFFISTFFLFILSTTVPSCARFNDAVADVPFGMRWTVPGLSVGADNGEDGVDASIDFSPRLAFKAFVSIFWKLPVDVLAYFAQVLSGLFDPDADNDPTDTAVYDSSKTDDLELNKNMEPIMRLPTKAQNTEEIAPSQGPQPQPQGGG